MFISRSQTYLHMPGELVRNLKDIYWYAKVTRFNADVFQWMCLRSSESVLVWSLSLFLILLLAIRTVQQYMNNEKTHYIKVLIQEKSCKHQNFSISLKKCHANERFLHSPHHRLWSTESSRGVSSTTVTITTHRNMEPAETVWHDTGNSIQQPWWCVLWNKFLTGGVLSAQDIDGLIMTRISSI